MLTVHAASAVTPCFHTCRFGSCVTSCPAPSSAPPPPRRVWRCCRMLFARQRSGQPGWRWSATQGQRPQRAPAGVLARAVPSRRVPLTAAARLSWRLRSSCCARSCRRPRWVVGTGSTACVGGCWLTGWRRPPTPMLLASWRCTVVSPSRFPCPCPAAGDCRGRHRPLQAV